MPKLPDDDQTQGPKFSSHPSVAIELDWMLSVAQRLGGVRPALEELYRLDPALVRRVSGLWEQEYQLSYPGYPELSVAARQGGVLFSSDGEGFVAALDGLLKRTPEDLPLRAETPDDRQRILSRLRLLRASAKRRRPYVDLAGEVWAAMQEEWERFGLAAVEADVAARRMLIARRPSWKEFVPETCHSIDRIEEMVSRLGPEGEVVVVPAYYARTKLVIDLPGLLLISVPPSEAAGARARTEALAHRLKAVSDPTRLAILEGLSRSDMTITEIAQRYSLAQPTVSNHVKLLRDAGIVATDNHGRSRRLSLRHEALEAILAEFRHLLGHPAGPMGPRTTPRSP